MPRVDGSGNISINVRFLGVGLGQPVALATTPARTPVTMDDATFAFGMRNRAAQDKTEVGQSIVCDGVLAYSKALDKGRRPANIPTSEYSRYEVRFTVASLGCHDSTRRFQAASR
ncbi:hypothetical protein ACIP1G_02270 [Pseudomonas sp. NPDC089392]|uniref:hypothetical protein n=1 Tax=Pseudomonas sp. NPDC089392 TaxID=3364459 RepID=UPI0037FCDDC1